MTDPFALNHLLNIVTPYGLIGLLVGLALTPVYLMNLFPKHRTESGLGVALLAFLIFGLSGMGLGATIGFEKGATSTMDTIVAGTSDKVSVALKDLGLDPSKLPLGMLVKVWKKLPIPQLLVNNADLPSLSSDFTSLDHLLRDLEKLALDKIFAFLPFLYGLFACLPVIYGFAAYFLVRSENNDARRKARAADNNEIAL